MTLYTVDGVFEVETSMDFVAALIGIFPMIIIYILKMATFVKWHANLGASTYIVSIGVRKW